MTTQLLLVAKSMKPSKFKRHLEETLSKMVNFHIQHVMLKMLHTVVPMQFMVILIHYLFLLCLFTVFGYVLCMRIPYSFLFSLFISPSKSLAHLLFACIGMSLCWLGTCCSLFEAKQWERIYMISSCY